MNIVKAFTFIDTFVTFMGGMVWTRPVTDFSSQKFDQKSRKIFVDVQRNYVSSSAAAAARVFNNNE